MWRWHWRSREGGGSRMGGGVSEEGSCAGKATMMDEEGGDDGLGKH